MLFTVKNISPARVAGVLPGATAEIDTEPHPKLAKILTELCEGHTSMSEEAKAYRSARRFGDASPWPPKLALISIDGEEPAPRVKPTKGKGRGKSAEEPDYSTALAEIEKETDPKALEELAADKEIPAVLRQAIAKRIQSLAASKR